MYLGGTDVCNTRFLRVGEKSVACEHQVQSERKKTEKEEETQGKERSWWSGTTCHVTYLQVTCLEVGDEVLESWLKQIIFFLCGGIFKVHLFWQNFSLFGWDANSTGRLEVPLGGRSCQDLFSGCFTPAFCLFVKHADVHVCEKLTMSVSVKRLRVRVCECRCACL